jgi:hypothetical protein
VVIAGEASRIFSNNYKENMMMKYEMQYAGPKRRVRRDWRGTVLTGLTLLSMAALCGWLWSLVSRCSMLDAGCWMLATSNEPLVAMAPWAEGSMMGLMLFVSVLLILLAVRKVEENERWCEGVRQRELERRQRIEKAARFWDEKTGEEKGWDEPLTEADEGIRAPMEALAPAELRRIVGALIVETCAARDDVRKRKINEAEAKLHLVIGCLTGLIERMKDEGGMMKNEEVRP